MRRTALIAILALGACTGGPNLGVGFGLGGGGVSVHPTVSGSVGGVGVSVSG